MCGRKVTCWRRVAIGVEPCKAENTAIMISGAGLVTPFRLIQKPSTNGVKARKSVVDGSTGFVVTVFNV